MRRAAALGTALVLAASLSACSGTSEGPKKSASVEEDRAAVEKTNLKLADFPQDQGWTSAPHQRTADEEASARQFAECLGIPDPGARYRVDVRSPDFSRGSTSASSEVRFTNTEADASADLEALQSSKGPVCYKQTIERLIPARLPPEATTENLAVRQLEFPPLKDGTAALQASLTLNIRGLPAIPVYADLIAFRSGRAEVLLTTLNTGSPFDPTLEQELAKKMAARA